MIKFTEREVRDMLDQWLKRSVGWRDMQPPSDVRTATLMMLTQLADMLAEREKAEPTQDMIDLALEATVHNGSVPYKVREVLHDPHPRLVMLAALWAAGLKQDTRPAAQPRVPDGYFIGGPHASAMVYDMADAENVIAALAKRTGDDEDDYTVTSLAAKEGRSRE